MFRLKLYKIKNIIALDQTILQNPFKNILSNISLNWQSYKLINNIFGLKEKNENIENNLLKDHSGKKSGLTLNLNNLKKLSKITYDYIFRNPFNSNHNHLSLEINKTLKFYNTEISQITNIVNKMVEINSEISYLKIYNCEYKEFLYEGISILPKTNKNKYVKKINKFNTFLALNQNVLYHFKKQKTITTASIYKLLYGSLNPTLALISQPHITFFANKVLINLNYFYFTLKNVKNKLNTQSFLEKNAKRFKFLSQILSEKFKKELILDFSRLYHVASDGNILAKSMSTLSKKTKIRLIIKNLLKKARIVNPTRIVDSLNYKYETDYETTKITPGYLSGINIRFAGRPGSEKVVPRKTVRNFQRGSLARGKATIVKTDRFTGINKRGSYSVTIKSGHYIH